MSIRKHLARIKRKVLKKPFLKDDRHPPYWFDKTLGQQAIRLVQIGSNDGKTGDPFNELLHKHPHWKALFVEPVPYLFERLQANYPDKTRFQFANVAINEGMPLNFYWVDPAVKETFNDLPFWYDQLGSFDKQHIINQLGERIAPYVLSEQLQGRTLPALLEEQGIEAIDILHIDTEGYDWKILQQLNLERFRPHFILYESNHLSPEELQDSYKFLKDHYVLFDAGIDVLAVNKEHLADYIQPMQQRMKTLEVL